MSKWTYLTAGMFFGIVATTATIVAAAQTRKQIEDRNRERKTLPEGWKVYVNEDFRPS